MKTTPHSDGGRHASRLPLCALRRSTQRTGAFRPTTALFGRQGGVVSRERLCRSNHADLGRAVCQERTGRTHGRFGRPRAHERLGRGCGALERSSRPLQRPSHDGHGDDALHRDTLSTCRDERVLRSGTAAAYRGGRRRACGSGRPFRCCLLPCRDCVRARRGGERTRRPR